VTPLTLPFPNSCSSARPRPRFAVGRSSKGQKRRAYRNDDHDQTTTPNTTQSPASTPALKTTRRRLWSSSRRAIREAMHIGITGASGFLGQQIVRDALSRGHRVTPFSRRTGASAPGCETARVFGTKIDLSGIEAVVHLAGESILGLWTQQKRSKILHSRIEGTRWIVDAIGRTENKPSVLVGASGAGIYGDRGEEILTEHSPVTSAGFLAEVATVWEAEGSKAEAAGVRYVPVRIALVLGKTGGAMPLMKTAFRMGLGGKLGSGKQWMSWIHIADISALFMHVLETKSILGPVNGASPNPARNEEFTKIMGDLFRRPTFLAAPEFALRMLPANQASLILDSQRIVPEKALESGFRFRFPDLRRALADVLT
jgi:uncharacterized protein